MLQWSPQGVFNNSGPAPSYSPPQIANEIAPYSRDPSSQVTTNKLPVPSGGALVGTVGSPVDKVPAPPAPPKPSGTTQYHPMSGTWIPIETDFNAFSEMYLQQNPDKRPSPAQPDGGSEFGGGPTQPPSATTPKTGAVTPQNMDESKWLDPKGDGNVSYMQQYLRDLYKTGNFNDLNQYGDFLFEAKRTGTLPYLDKIFGWPDGSTNNWINDRGQDWWNEYYQKNNIPLEDRSFPNSNGVGPTPPPTGDNDSPVTSNPTNKVYDEAIAKADIPSQGKSWLGDMISEGKLDENQTINKYWDWMNEWYSNNDTPTETLGNDSALSDYVTNLDAIVQSSNPLNSAKNADLQKRKDDVIQSGLLSEQLNNITASDSEYIRQARQRAAEQANSRGLLNSSLASGAGERAAIESALPIAQGDIQAQQFNANALNRADELDKTEYNNLATKDAEIEIDKNRAAVDSAIKMNENKYTTNTQNWIEAQRRERDKQQTIISSAMDTLGKGYEAEVANWMENQNLARQQGLKAYEAHIQSLLDDRKYAHDTQIANINASATRNNTDGLSAFAQFYASIATDADMTPAEKADHLAAWNSYVGRYL